MWDVETGKEVATLKGHTGEIVSLHFNAEGDKILTGSFDRTAMVSFYLLLILVIIYLNIGLGYQNWRMYSYFR